LGCEGRSDVVLVEAKVGAPLDFIVRQLFYPYRKWRSEIPQKRIRPWFFCSSEISGKRLYRFWEYEFTDDNQYLSLRLKHGESFLVEPERKRLAVEELLSAHVARRSQSHTWEVPQADSFWRVAEIPLLVEQGINTSTRVAVHYGFDPRQSSYYRQAAEFLGLVRQEKDFTYVLTDLGREYVNRPADERRQLLAGLLAHFPPMRAALELLARTGQREITKADIAAQLERHANIRASTPARRASTILAWLHWLQSATGAVQTQGSGFVLR